RDRLVRVAGDALLQRRLVRIAARAAAAVRPAGDLADQYARVVLDPRPEVRDRHRGDHDRDDEQRTEVLRRRLASFVPHRGGPYGRHRVLTSAPRLNLLRARPQSPVGPSAPAVHWDVGLQIADRIRDDVTTALKAGDRDRVTALRLVLSELQK